MALSYMRALCLWHLHRSKPRRRLRHRLLLFRLHLLLTRLHRPPPSRPGCCARRSGRAASRLSDHPKTETWATSSRPCCRSRRRFNIASIPHFGSTALRSSRRVATAGFHLGQASDRSALRRCEGIRATLRPPRTWRRDRVLHRRRGAARVPRVRADTPSGRPDPARAAVPGVASKVLRRADFGRPGRL